MEFTVKKILGSLLMPTAVIALVLIIACLGLFLKRWHNTSRYLVLICTALLLVFSTPFVPNEMLSHLESQYRPLAQPSRSISSIVVLGSGVRSRTDAPPNTQLGAASLSRLVEGVRLYQAIKHLGGKANLVLSGGHAFGHIKTKHSLLNSAVILGVAPRDIILEPGSKNTYQEALHIKKILGNKPFILVTSASHMPRTMQLFKKQGMQPTPAPTQFISARSSNSPGYLLPNASHLINANIAMHEYLGIWWAKMIGRA